MGNSFFAGFRNIWNGGYFEGEPTDPMAPSSYGIFGYHSSLYVTYLSCIKPYIDSDSVALEIGPGRGAWSKAIADLGPRALYVVDVVPAEHSGFWSYMGRRQNVHYLIAEDFSLSGVPDGVVNYFFSYGCFCHLTPEMCTSYINSLARKMKSGAHGFLMIADNDKYNACIADYRKHSVWRALVGKRLALARAAFAYCVRRWPGDFIRPALNQSTPAGPHPGAWLHLGIEAACHELSKAGFRVIERDMQVNHRDPIIHFAKI